MQSLGYGFAFRLVPRGTKRTGYVDIQLGHLWWLWHCISGWPLYSRIEHWKFGIFIYIFFKQKKRKTLILLKLMICFIQRLTLVKKRHLINVRYLNRVGEHATMELV